MKKLMMVAVAALCVGAFAHAEDTKKMDSSETTTSADGAMKHTEKHAHKGAHGKMKSEKTVKKDADGSMKTETETKTAPAEAPATK
jgi:hypothetical protein